MDCVDQEHYSPASDFGALHSESGDGDREFLHDLDVDISDDREVVGDAEALAECLQHDAHGEVRRCRV